MGVGLVIAIGPLQNSVCKEEDKHGVDNYLEFHSQASPFQFDDSKGFR